MENILRAGKASAKIVNLGAELKSLVLNGRELMWEANQRYWGKTSPVLFPNVGGLRGNRTMIDGREYKMMKHGFARDTEFQTLSSSDGKITFMMESTPETLRCFPFEFQLTLQYTLYPEKLEILYGVTNKSAIAMPYCIGAHPAFACPIGGKDFSDYRLVFEEKETICSPALDSRTRMFSEEGAVWRLKNSREYPLDYDDFKNDVLYFRNIISNNVSLVDNEGRGLKVSWDGFHSLGVWTPAGLNAPFVCIEPWCGCDDYENSSGDFRDKPEVETALPGGTRYYVMTIETVDDISKEIIK